MGQDLELRAFSATPVGMNFGVLALGHASGTVLFDQATKIEDVTGKITSVAGVYGRSLSVFGAAGKIVAVVPFLWGDWEGMYQGAPASASRRGMADPLVELSVNFLGAPAMTMAQMRTYSQKWVVGGSIKVSVPVGQYLPEKLLNLGANRWAVRPRFGVSRKSGRLALEGMASVWLYEINDDFFGGSSLAKEPLWSLQFNGVYQWLSGLWLGVGAGFSRGGQSSVNDLISDTYQKTTRWAAVLSVPVAKRHSLKVLFANGLSTRVGADLTNVSLAWSWRWGGEG